MFKNITGFFVKKNEEENKGKPRNRTLENLIVIVILGVIILLATTFLFDSNPSKDTLKDASSVTSGDKGSGSFSQMNGEDMLLEIEQRLAELLSHVEGAGQVKVMIYADTSTELIPAYNNEQDTRNDERNDGKTSQISETREIALSGDDTPIILKTIVPQIKGVVVVAEGADDMLIKAQLNNAVCTLLGIPEHRVQILKHK
mgnify:CR=1 FL=1|jgi:stage III sporulation protein AG